MRPFTTTFTLLFATGAVALALASTAHATPLLLPTGLNPGDQYRVAFVTSTTRDASSSDIGDYNTFVRSLANSVPDLWALGTMWRAIGSTTARDARDNTNTNVASDGAGVPIYLLNDTLLAADNADLWDGDLLTTLSINEVGVALSVTVWTGTSGDGTALLPIGSSNTRTGTTTSSTSSWISLGSLGNFQTHSMYALSGVLTAVPEPGTGLLLGMSLVATMAGRRRSV